MTWWYLDNRIGESMLSAPCKHVLKTLGRQINPPDDWDATDPEAWDPATHRKALLVWYDRVKLSLLTSYSPDSLRRIMGQLGPPPDDDDPRRKKRDNMTYYGVLPVEKDAAQHQTALLRIDLDALRALHDPRLDALEAQRHKAREVRQTHRRRRVRIDEERSQGTYLTPSARPEAMTQGTYLTPPFHLVVLHL